MDLRNGSKLVGNINNATTSSTLMTPPTTPYTSSSNAAGVNINTTTSSTTTPKKGREESGGSSQNQNQRPRLIVDFSDLTVPVPSTPRSLQPEELRRLFLVSLEKMFALEESKPFRQPVDPQALGLPDYNDIIRKPMDLQTIRIKMNCLKYTDPFMYIDDVILMFDNCFVYNRPSGKVYQYCEKLSEVFQQEINPVMTRLGYRHGRIHQFNSETLSCFGRPCCLILRNATYYNFLRFHLCEKCYSANLEDDGINLPWQNNVTVDKENFIKLHNDSENSYSPAAEMHRAYQRDAQMSRQLVVREFLKLLSSSTIHPDKKKNVRKMLRLNGQLRSEFIQYFHQEADAYLLTPTEVERIKQQLRIIEDGEPPEQQQQQLTKNINEAETEISKCVIDDENDANENQDNRNRNRTQQPDVINVQVDDDRDNVDHNNPNTSSLSSHLGGIELESSSGSSNCSTLSSLKSLN